MDILASLQSIGFDWKLAIAHVVNFLIVFALLKYFLFDSIAGTLSERRAKIKSGLAEAEEAKEHKEKAEKHYEKRVDEATAEAQEILRSAREQGDKMIARAKNEAQSEADEIIENAQKKIEQERAEMEADLEEKTADLVVSGVNKILEEKIDESEGKRIISRGVSEVNEASHG